MVIKALNSENLKELERETERKESKKNNEQTSLVNRFLDQAQPGEKPSGRSRTNRSIGSSIPLEPRVPNYHRHPQISAQEDHRSSIVDRAQLLKSRAETRSSKKKKKKTSETHSQKSSQPKHIKKRKVSALSSSIKRLPDSLPNPGKSKKPRLTINRHLPSQGIFKKAVYGSAGHTKRRNTWGGDLTFNELGFLDKERKSRQRREEKTEQINKEGQKKKSSSYSNVSSEKRKHTVSLQESSKSSLHPSGIDPCKMRQGNAPSKSFSPSTRRHSGMPSSGHSAYSIRMRERAAKQTPQLVSSTSHQPDREETKQHSSPSEHRTCPTNQAQDGRHAHPLEQPPVEKSQLHEKSPYKSPPLSSSSRTRLIINQPFSSRSSLTNLGGGYGTHSFTQTAHRSYIGRLSPDDRVSSQTLANDNAEISNRIDYQDMEEEEENEGEPAICNSLSLLLEESEFLQNDENQSYFAGRSLPEEHYSRRFQSGRPVSFSDGAPVGPEYLDIDYPEERVESDVYPDLLVDRPELLYDQDDSDVDVDDYYSDDVLLPLDDDYGGYSDLEEDRGHQTYQTYDEVLDEEADDGDEWLEHDPPTFEGYEGYEEDDVVIPESELDYPGLDLYSQDYMNDRYLVEPVVNCRPTYSGSSEDWLRSSVWSDY